MPVYRRVQFIGYAIPSIPRGLKQIGDPNAPPYIEGHYVGIEPPSADIKARIALCMKAVRQTIASGTVDESPSTLKIFVMPEFSFRGTQGAYFDDPPDIDYFNEFRRELANRVGHPRYEGWLFVAGTIVNTAGYVPGNNPNRDLKARLRENLAIAIAHVWQYASKTGDRPLAAFVTQMLHSYGQYCHDHPTFEVTDKCFVIAGGAPDPDYPEGLSVEKRFLSNEDFVLNLQTNAFAEDQVGYPPIIERDGEDKRHAFDPLSIFTIKGIKFGLEVCLDHLGGRLRRNRKPSTELVQIHLVPSCGMQIAQPAVIAGPGGLVFNCDGQYDQVLPISKPSPRQSIWTGTTSHLAHSQLTQVVRACHGKNLLRQDAVLRKPRAKVHRVAIRDRTAAKLYAHGAGEVHVYTPLRMPPPVTD